MNVNFKEVGFLLELLLKRLLGGTYRDPPVVLQTSDLMELMELHTNEEHLIRPVEHKL